MYVDDVDVEETYGIGDTDVRHNIGGVVLYLFMYRYRLKIQSKVFDSEDVMSRIKLNYVHNILK